MCVGVCATVSSHCLTMWDEKSINTNAEVAPWLQEGGVQGKSTDMIKLFCMLEWDVKSRREREQWRDTRETAQAVYC